MALVDTHRSVTVTLGLVGVEEGVACHVLPRFLCSPWKRSGWLWGTCGLLRSQARPCQEGFPVPQSHFGLLGFWDGRDAGWDSLQKGS